MDKLVKQWMTALLLAALVGLWGCSDDTNTGTDGAVDGTAQQDQTTQSDGPTVDKPTAKDITPDKGGTDYAGMGEGCTKGADCKGKDLMCLTISSTKGAGVCTFNCIKDDSKTPLVNEDNCTKGFRCAALTMNDKSVKNYCLQECTPSFTKNPCPASSKVTCHPSSTRYAQVGQAVCFYTACQNSEDCPVFGTKSCYTDNDCKTINKDAFCSDNLCARPGNCTKGGICGKHTGVGSTTAKVGDVCASDLDCPENGRCIPESSKVSTSIGTYFRNGYCTVRGCMFGKVLTDFSCPAGTVCNNLYYGGYCFKACSVNSKTDCRNNPKDKGGDYECYDWTNWTISGLKVATGPICIGASTQRCNTLGTKSTCKSLGDATNSSNMSCRDRYTGKAKSNPRDPVGVCLDDTPSGAFLSHAPDGGYPNWDSIAPAPDAGKGG